MSSPLMWGSTKARAAEGSVGGCSRSHPLSNGDMAMGGPGMRRRVWVGMVVMGERWDTRWGGMLA